MTLKKVRLFFLFSFPCSSSLSRPPLRAGSSCLLQQPSLALAPEGCRSPSLACLAPFQGGNILCLVSWLDSPMSQLDLEVCHIGWQSSMGAKALCQCMASLLAAWLAYHGQLWMNMVGGWEQQHQFGLLHSPSGFAAAVWSENKPKCSTKGQQAQRPPACCRLSRPGSSGVPAAGAHPLLAERLSKLPPPLPFLG